MVLSRKSLYKTISWRILSIIIGFFVTYFYLNSVEIATILTIIHHSIATVLYYYHEMFWKLVRKKGWLNI